MAQSSVLNGTESLPVQSESSTRSVRVSEHTYQSVAAHHALPTSRGPHGLTFPFWVFPPLHRKFHVMVCSLGLSYLHRFYLWVFLAPVSALCAPSGHLATLRTDFSPLFCCGFLASLTSVSVLCRIPGLSSTSLARILRYGESPSLSMPVQTQSVGAFLLSSVDIVALLPFILLRS